MRSVFQSAKDAFIVVDETGTIVAWNEGAEHIFGYTAEERVGDKLHRIIPDRYRDAHTSGFTRYLATHQKRILDRTVELEGLRKDGVEIPIELSLASFVTGGKTFFTGIIRDISERKRHQQELLETRRLFNLISENSRDVISYNTPDGICRYVSASIRTWLGFEPKELIGRPASLIFHPDDLPTVRQIERRLSEGEDVERFTCRVLSKIGRPHWFETTLRAIRDEQGELLQVVGISRDVTDRKEAEQMVMNTEKLAAVGQMAAGIVHEIRNPLTSLIGFTQLMQELPAEDHSQRLAIMRGELNRIEAILNELLVLAKPQVMHIRRTDLRLLLSEVITLLTAQAAIRNVIFTIPDLVELPLVDCDPNQLKQVFINFIKNSIEAMPQGGTVTLNLSTVPDGVCVECADDGPGMPDDRVQRLGTPFYSTKEKGTGLGFMVSRKIIESHRGRIHVESEVGVGTTIQVILPVTQSS